MRKDARSEFSREHLSAQAQSENGALFPQRDFEPIDFTSNPFVGIVDAHRTAKDNDAFVIIHALRQRLAQSRTAYVKLQAFRLQSTSNTPRS